MFHKIMLRLCIALPKPDPLMCEPFMLRLLCWWIVIISENHMFCSKIWITMEVAIMKEITLLFLEFITICCVTTKGSRNLEHLISGGLRISGPINRMSLRLMIKFSSDCGILGSKMIYLPLCFRFNWFLCVCIW